MPRRKATGGVIGGDNFVPLVHPHEVNERKQTFEAWLDNEHVKSGLLVDEDPAVCKAMIGGIMMQYLNRKEAGEDQATLAADTVETLRSLGLLLPASVRTTAPESMSSKQRVAVSYDVWRAAKQAEWEARRRQGQRSTLVTGNHSLTDEDKKELQDQRATDRRMLRNGIMTAVQILQESGVVDRALEVKEADLDALDIRGFGLDKDK